MEFVSSGQPVHQHILLEGCDGIRVDVTGNCNLRCPYCINDFSQVHGNTLMTLELFDRVTRLFPLLRPAGQLLFSCYFEPTIHPQFLDMLCRVPPEWSSRGGFTTNLGRRLPDTFFERLVELKIGYINVSLDSLSVAVFEEMRKGIHFDVFKHNLERLVDACSASEHGPDIHFISMVSKLNLAEIPDLIRRCAEAYRPKRHEIRGIWMTPEIEQRPWIQSHAIDVDDLLMLRRQLAELPPHVDLVFDLPGNPEAFTTFPAKTEKSFERFVRELADPGLQRAYSVPVAPILQIASDGIVRFLIAGPELQIDLKAIEDPVPIVGQFLVLQNLNVARAALLRKSTVENLELRRVSLLNQWLTEGLLKLQSDPDEPAGYMDEGQGEFPTPPQHHFRLSGWARNPRGVGPAEEVVLVAQNRGDRKIVAATVPEYERVDVALHFADSRLLHSGWTVEVETEGQCSGMEGSMLFEAYAFDPSTRTGYKLAGERKAVIGGQAARSERSNWPSSVLGFLKRPR